MFRLLGTRTTAGRHFDLSAVQNGLALPSHSLNSSDAVLTAVSVVSFVLMGGLLVGMSLFRRRFDLAAAVVVTLGGSFGTTEFLKSHLHHREGVPGHGRGFPSGHSTVALALGLSFVLVTPDRRRLVVAAAAALYAALMGASLSSMRGTFPPTWAAGSASQPPGRPARPNSREGRSSAGFPAVSSPLSSLLSSSPRRPRCTCGPVSVSA